MPTYLDNNSFANFQQQPFSNPFIAAGPTCRQVYDHLQTCPLCQQATKNKWQESSGFTASTNLSNRPDPTHPLSTSWSVQINPITIGFVLLLVLVIYLALRKTS